MLKEHLGYVADQPRLEKFRAAVSQVVRDGDRVCDLGCGSGVLGLLCLQANAAHVYAIDDSAMIEVAKESLLRAGFDAKATFVRGRSQQVNLPEIVDVVVCDHIGYFGFDYGIIRLLQDAKTRFLKPGGKLIPQRIQLKLAAIESETAHALAESWQDDKIPSEFHWLRQHSINTKHTIQFKPEELLGTAAELGNIDLAEDNSAFLSLAVELNIERDGIFHGLGGWFDCELSDGVWITNSPLSNQAIDRPQAFFPIDQAIKVEAGDRVKVTIMARPDDHLIAWLVEFPKTGQRFSHSTWQGILLSPEDIARTNPNRVPHLKASTKARMQILDYCDGQRTVHDIELAVLQDFPNLFGSAEEISKFVAIVLGRDTE